MEPLPGGERLKSNSRKSLRYSGQSQFRCDVVRKMCARLRSHKKDGTRARPECASLELVQSGTVTSPTECTERTDEKPAYNDDGPRAALLRRLQHRGSENR